eukprot:gene20326-biopygen6657
MDWLATLAHPREMVIETIPEISTEPSQCNLRSKKLPGRTNENFGGSFTNEFIDRLQLQGAWICSWPEVAQHGQGKEKLSNLNLRIRKSKCLVKSCRNRMKLNDDKQTPVHYHQASSDSDTISPKYNYSSNGVQATVTEF